MHFWISDSSERLAITHILCEHVFKHNTNVIFTTEHYYYFTQSSLAISTYSYLLLQEVRLKPEGNELKLCKARLNICKTWLILHKVPWLFMKPRGENNKT